MIVLLICTVALTVSLGFATWATHRAHRQAAAAREKGAQVEALCTEFFDDLTRDLANLAHDAEPRSEGSEREAQPGGELRELPPGFGRFRRTTVDLLTEVVESRQFVERVIGELGARNQNLLLRQLWILEKLELDGENERILAPLFALDRLAAQLRRHTSNALVIAGQLRPAHRMAAPVSTADLLMGSLSGTAQFERVTVISTAVERVRGPVAPHVIAILTELIDNALSFSDPDTKVFVECQPSSDGGLSITVLDSGLGIIDNDQLESINRLLSDRTVRLSPTERRVGLFVTRELAARHNITVRLEVGDMGGVVARIDAPPEVLIAPGRTATPPDSGDAAVSDSAENLELNDRADLGSERVGSGPIEDGENLTQVAEQPQPRDLRAARAGATAENDTPLALPQRLRGDSVPMFGPGRAFVVGTAVVSGNGLSAPTPRGEAHSALRENLWFGSPVTVAQEPRRRPRGQEPANSVAWDIDDGWKIVATVASQSITEDALTGLPIRERGAHLVPGSIQPRRLRWLDGTESANQPAPAVVRGRLGAYRAGVNRARYGDDPANIPDRPMAFRWGIVDTDE